MGVVGRPVLHTQNDGKIYIERASKKVEVKKLTSHHNFCNDVILNRQIKDGGWCELYLNNMAVDEMREALQEWYLPDDAVINRVVFICIMKVGNKSNKKRVSISEGNAKLEGLI